MKKTLSLFLLFFATSLFAEDKAPSNLADVEDEKLLAAIDKDVLPDGFGRADEDFIDPRVLRDFIESRSLIECRQKEGKLTIAGDVRARWIAQGEKYNHLKQRGTGTAHPINVFKSEVNLFFDYTAPRAWVTTKLKWAAVDGKDGGSLTKVEMDRAFIGYDIYECKKEDFYIEIGRSKFDYMYESRVEFSSIYDGIHLYYTDFYPTIGTFTIHGGPFIIDSETNHYGWIAEAGVKQLGGSFFSFKYNITDWYRHARTFNFGNVKDDLLIEDNPRYRFLVSQMLFGYEKPLDLPGCNTLYIYAAVLANHLAKKNRTTDFTYANKAWYAGFTLGKLCKACDWSIDVNYQYVQAQSIPEFDVSGIGNGNAPGVFLSDAINDHLEAFRGRGFTNYTGLECNALYALTDSLSLRAKGAFSVPINSHIGQSYFYKVFEMAVIYAF